MFARWLGTVDQFGLRDEGLIAVLPSSSNTVRVYHHIFGEQADYKSKKQEPVRITISPPLKTLTASTPQPTHIS